MALPPAFLDELRARTPLASLVSRRVKLARSGRHWKGCCPFHNERSPSFYVYEDGYHCFGCGAHGDAISFVMQTGGSTFPEAVEQLASEAGLEVPKPTPAAHAAEQRRHDLHSVLAAAAAAFARRLREPEGRAGLDYLLGRGLSDETIARFGLGWAGEGRGALAAELGREGIEPGMLVEAGLMKPADGGGPAREFFFRRVMFPIRDRRGRVISFGGRILGDGQPKYLNGPESPVFSKRRTLYGLDLAREAARGGAPVVAVEGYMDVIALHQAGFAGAVAPLGTALTAEQLEELWRLSPAPVLCFDGDAAGARAAARAAEVALPLLAPDRTLRLAAIRDGDDPDSLVRKGGPAGFQAVLDAARPLGDALFDLLREGVGDATPEKRAALRTRLVEASKRIADRSLAAEYRGVLLDRFFATYRRRGGPAPVPRAARPVPPPDGADGERMRNLVAILLRHPGLLHDLEDALAGLALPPALARLRDAMLDWPAMHTPHPPGMEAPPVLDSAALLTHLTASGLAPEVEQALSAHPAPLPSCTRPDAMPAEAEASWWHFFGLINRDRLDEEVAAASRAFATRPDEATQRRLLALVAARDALFSAGLEAEA